MGNSSNISRLAVHDQFQRLTVYSGVVLSVVIFLCIAIYGTAAESAGGDADLDGIPDTVDIDDDNDGVPDRFEIDAAGLDLDHDRDGIPDRLDLDSDSDGILDLEESGVFRTEAAIHMRFQGGRIRAAMGLNGFADLLETAQDNGQLAYKLLNSDADNGDVLPDYLDLDSDNDGLFDMLEAGVPSSLDSNRDARIDVSPGEVGVDGILDRLQIEQDVTCCDFDGDGVQEISPRNTDGGDFPDFQDHDSDNDGITDLVEAGGRDLNGDGYIDGFVDNPQEPDGIDDAFLAVPLSPEDSNGNGIADYIDVQVQFAGENVVGENSGNPSQPAGPASDDPEPAQDDEKPASTPEPAAPSPQSPDPEPAEPEPEQPGPAAPDSGEPDAAPAVANDDASPAVAFNDPIETGLSGNGGCTLVTNPRQVDPLLPLLCLLASVHLRLRRIGRRGGAFALKQKLMSGFIFKNWN